MCIRDSSNWVKNCTVTWVTIIVSDTKNECLAISAIHSEVTSVDVDVIIDSQLTTTKVSSNACFGLCSIIGISNALRHLDTEVRINSTINTVWEEELIANSNELLIVKFLGN